MKNIDMERKYWFEKKDANRMSNLQKQRNNRLIHKNYRKKSKNESEKKQKEKKIIKYDDIKKKSINFKEK